MNGNLYNYDNEKLFINRSGYTGEDGYEISLPNKLVEKFCKKLLEDKDVKLIGLGARDSLRLEAGLCLYGHDLDPKTTPIEGSLSWALSKKHKSERSFLGSEIVLKQIKDGTKTPEDLKNIDRTNIEIPILDLTVIGDSKYHGEHGEYS